MHTNSGNVAQRKEHRTLDQRIILCMGSNPGCDKKVFLGITLKCKWRQSSGVVGEGLKVMFIYNWIYGQKLLCLFYIGMQSVTHQSKVVVSFRKHTAMGQSLAHSKECNICVHSPAWTGWILYQSMDFVHNVIRELMQIISRTLTVVSYDKAFIPVSSWSYVLMIF